MNKSDFDKYNIEFFTYEGVLRANGNPEGMDIQVFCVLDRIRRRVKTPCRLLYNGLNSGKHASIYHKEGKAADVFFDSVNDPMDIIMIAVQEGITGIGVYWNNESKLWTFHFDLGRQRFWTARKERTRDSWTYYNTFQIKPVSK